MIVADDDPARFRGVHLITYIYAAPRLEDS
jgi:hypothetical protein